MVKVFFEGVVLKADLERDMAPIFDPAREEVALPKLDGFSCLAIFFDPTLEVCFLADLAIVMVSVKA